MVEQNLKGIVDVGRHGTTVISLTALGTEIDGSAMTALYPSGMVEVSGAIVEHAGNGTDATVIRGRAALLSRRAVPVRVELFRTIGGAHAMVAEYDLEDAGSPEWKFSDDFQSLPMLVDFRLAGSDDAASSLLDRLKIAKPRYVVASHRRTWNAIGLEPGLNFLGKLPQSTVAGPLASLSVAEAELALHGLIRFAAPAQPARAYAWGSPPWLEAAPPAGIVLKAATALEPIKVADTIELHIKEYCAYSPIERAAIPGLVPISGFLGEIRFSSSGQPKTIQTLCLVAPESRELTLACGRTGVTLGKIADLGGLAGSLVTAFEWPAGLKDVIDSAARIELADVAITVDQSAALPSVSRIGLALVLDQTWRIVPDVLELSGLRADIAVYRPFSAKPNLTASVSGRIAVADGWLIDVEASNQDDFTIKAWLAKGKTLPLAGVMKKYLPGMESIGDLTIDQASIVIAPKKYYRLALALANEPNRWRLPLGPTTLEVYDVGLSVTKIDGGASYGRLGGKVAIGTLGRFELDCAVPGSFVATAKIDKVDLTELARAVAAVSSLQLPVGFPQIILRDTEITFAREPGPAPLYEFGLATTIKIKRAKVRLLAKIVKAGSNYGFGFGLAAQSTDGLGWSPGEIWAPLRGLTIDKATVLVTTIAPQNFQAATFFEAGAAPDTGTDQARFVPKAGFNFFCQMRLAQGPLSALGGVLGESSTLQVFAALGLDRSVELSAALVTRYASGPFTFDGVTLNWKLSSAETSITLVGGGSLKIQDDSLSYLVAGRLASGGSGSLTLRIRDWAHPFGYQRLTIKDFMATVVVKPGMVTVQLGGSFAFVTSRGKKFTFTVAFGVTGFQAPTALICAFVSDRSSSSAPALLSIGEILEGITTVDIYANTDPATEPEWVKVIKILDRFLKIAELQFWIVQDEAIEINAVTYRRGFGLIGDLTLLDTPAKFHLSVKQDDLDISGGAEFPTELRFASVLVLTRPTLELTLGGAAAVPSRKGEAVLAKAGPVLSFSTKPDGEGRYFYLACRLRFLDLLDINVQGLATDGGLEFQLKVSGQLGASRATFNSALLIDIANFEFRLGLAFDLALANIRLGGWTLFDKIEIPEFTIIDLKLKVAGAIHARMKRNPGLDLSGRLNFELNGLQVGGSFAIKIPLPGLNKLGDFANWLRSEVEEHKHKHIQTGLTTPELFVQFVNSSVPDAAKQLATIGEILRTQYSVVSASAARPLLSIFGSTDEAVEAVVRESFMQAPEAPSVACRDSILLVGWREVRLASGYRVRLLDVAGAPLAPQPAYTIDVSSRTATFQSSAFRTGDIVSVQVAATVGATVSAWSPATRAELVWLPAPALLSVINEPDRVIVIVAPVELATGYEAEIVTLSGDAFDLPIRGQASEPRITIPAARLKADEPYAVRVRALHAARS